MRRPSATCVPLDLLRFTRESARLSAFDLLQVQGPAGWALQNTRLVGTPSASLPTGTRRASCYRMPRGRSIPPIRIRGRAADPAVGLEPDDPLRARARRSARRSCRLQLVLSSSPEGGGRASDSDAIARAALRPAARESALLQFEFERRSRALLHRRGRIHLALPRMRSRVPRARATLRGAPNALGEVWLAAVMAKKFRLTASGVALREMADEDLTLALRIELVLLLLQNDPHAFGGALQFF